jgi:hypothetical protein
MQVEAVRVGEEGGPEDGGGLDAEDFLPYQDYREHPIIS